MNKRRLIFYTLLITILLWGLLVVVLMTLIIQRGDQNHAAPADVIIVLGAGVRSDGSPDLALTRRSLWASQLYREGYAPVILCSGGIAPDKPRSEAEACREVLMRSGVPDEAIFLENESRSTEENALYSAPIIVENGWQSILLVTDSFHMLRAEWLFASVNAEIIVAPVPRDQVRSASYRYSFIREILAFHWHVFKTALGLPFTHVP